jgi:hypothetical protein
VSAALEKSLQGYTEQVLRWNRQINLVSRQDPRGNLAGLVRQCREAWSVLAAEQDFQPDERLWYFDLGSGGGLPGFVWHALAVDAGLNLATWLVEPREKRAWFLNRLSGLLEGAPLTVLSSRWGEIDDFGPFGDKTGPARVVVSLKALHLTDSEVLAGLAPALAGVPETGHTQPDIFPHGFEQRVVDLFVVDGHRLEILKHKPLLNECFLLV